MFRASSLSILYRACISSILRARVSQKFSFFNWQKLRLMLEPRWGLEASCVHPPSLLRFLGHGSFFCLSLVFHCCCLFCFCLGVSVHLLFCFVVCVALFCVVFALFCFIMFCFVVFSFVLLCFVYCFVCMCVCVFYMRSISS